MNRRAFLKAGACAVAVAAVGIVSATAAKRLEWWLPWTRMTAIGIDGREWNGIACRQGARTWLASVDFQESATIIGCRTPMGSYRWFSPIYVANGDTIEFNYTVDIELPDKLPPYIPSGWHDHADQGPRRVL